jgi:hypothetical protein
MKRFHLSRPVKILWVLAFGLFLMALGQSCTRNISVAPVPSALFTRTPTFTATPTPTCTDTTTFTATPSASPTRTFSATASPTPTPTRTITPIPTNTPSETPVPTGTPTDIPTDTPIPTVTPTVIPTDTPTDIPTGIPTDTPSETPVAADTPTQTPTETQTPICTIIPVNQVNYTELEPVGNGGTITGTNDTCATAENIGTLNAGNDVVVTGSLAPTDQDMYLFTAGSTGTYYIYLDCFSSGADNVLLNLDIYDSSCNRVFQSGAQGPLNWVGGPITAGQSFIFVVYGNNGTAALPYRLTFVPPPLPTPTYTPCGFPADTCTPTETAVPICTVTPVAPIQYTELEASGTGGTPGGTNDSCATAENVGTVSSGNSVEIHGSLASTGGGHWDFSKDQDYYLFTAGSDGIYNFYLDCYSSGSDNNLVDIALFDASCGYINETGYGSPVLSLPATLTSGSQYIFVVFGFDGTAPLPYRFTFSPP